MKKLIFIVAVIFILYFGGQYLSNSFKNIDQNNQFLNFLNSLESPSKNLTFPSLPQGSGNTQTLNFSFGNNQNSQASTQVDNSQNNTASSNLNESIPNSKLAFPQGDEEINGVLLTNMLKGNTAISNAAQKITASYNTPVEKAEALYVWIAANINYDNAYAKDISENDFLPNMGTAIDVFNSREAVCSGFASLYFVMAKDVGLNVKLISGKGLGDKYNNLWGNHMWNEVYINNQWISVDTTFANSYTVAMKKIDAKPQLKGYFTNENTVINKLNGFTMETYTVPSADFFDPANFYTTHKDSETMAIWTN